MAVASLSRLSASANRVSRAGAPSRRKSETTAIGSVALMSAANTSASAGRSWTGAPTARSVNGTITAVTAVAITTPGTESRKSTIRLFHRSTARRLNAASNTRPGRTSANNNSCVRWSGVASSSAPRTSPATTRATVYGTRTRRATTATTVATTNKSTISAPTSSRMSPPMARARQWPAHPWQSHRRLQHHQKRQVEVVLARQQIRIPVRHDRAGRAVGPPGNVLPPRHTKYGTFGAPWCIRGRPGREVGGLHRRSPRPRRSCRRAREPTSCCCRKGIRSRPRAGTGPRSSPSIRARRPPHS